MRWVTLINRQLKAGIPILFGLAAAALVMQFSGYDPLKGIASLWEGATGLHPGPGLQAGDLSWHIGPWAYSLTPFTLAQSLARATPILLTGTSVAIALRAGLFNIGAQGQMLLGALAAAILGQLVWPSSLGLLSLPLILCGGALTGALWGALPGWLRAVRGVHEVIATIMLNYVAANFADYLITHNLKDPQGVAPQTQLIAQVAWMTPLAPGSNLTWGSAIAVGAVAIALFLLYRTKFGFQIRAVGDGSNAARAAGISVESTLIRCMALSGALSGLAGALEVAAVHHRYVQGLGATYGFDGIAVALLGGPGAGLVASALFFGALANGANYIQLLTEVPASIAGMIQAVIIVTAGVRHWPGWVTRRGKFKKPATPDEACDR